MTVFDENQWNRYIISARFFLEWLKHVSLHNNIKNEKSAKFLNLDLASYSQTFDEFVKRVHEITGDVLITSPNDFNGLNKFLEKQVI